MRTATLLLSLLLLTGVVAAEEPPEAELTEVPAGLAAGAASNAEEPLPDILPPRAELTEDALIVNTNNYADMELVDGRLIVGGTAQADTEADNVAQARAMAEKTAQYAARAILVEVFTDLGFSSTDAQANANNAKPAGTDYYEDGTVVYMMSLNLGGEGGLAEAFGVELVER
ncbi:MAG: hypothetical protein GF403_06460 [Candidatus Coatesbacteria bacterium]|nr:hypothetical protein [Candidatus Coatesbacteria bacterium]